MMMANDGGRRRRKRGKGGGGGGGEGEVFDLGRGGDGSDGAVRLIAPGTELRRGGASLHTFGAMFGVKRGGRRPRNIASM